MINTGYGMSRLDNGLPIPVQAKLPEETVYYLSGSRHFALLVGIFDAQIKCTIGVFGQCIGVSGSPQSPNVEKAGGRGSKASADHDTEILPLVMVQLARRYGDFDRSGGGFPERH